MEIIYNKGTKRLIDNDEANLQVRGAVTFLDVLGWKGIWQDIKHEKNEESPIKKLTRLIRNIKKHAEEVVVNYGPSGLQRGKDFEVEILSISDTIVFFTEGMPEKTIAIHCDLCAWTINEALKMGFPLRGAISYGVYDHNDSIMIGPAVDEAASWHESTDWIGVILTPSAFFELKGKKPVNVEKYERIPYKKAIKGTEWCVDWGYEGCKNNEDIYSVFSSRGPLMQEVAPKYLNTLAFLDRDKNT